MAINLESIAKELAPEISRRLLAAADPKKTEADFRREAALILDHVASRAGVAMTVRDEYQVARGRVDSMYNRLIIEYERPGTLRERNSSPGNKHAIEQVRDYILGVAKRERREAVRLAGVAIDGKRFIFVRRVGEGWSEEDPVETSPASVERFLRLLFALAVGAALVPENLLTDFGPKTPRARQATQALYAALHRSKPPLVTKLFEQWQTFYSEVTDYKEWAESLKRKEEFLSFVKGMGLDPNEAEPAHVFFAVHTYYALLVKLIASLAAARFAGGTTPPLARMASGSSEDLRHHLNNLENRGWPFNEYGIRNFLEGDFFGWYLATWHEEVEAAVRELVMRLAEYDPATLDLAPENARDLLKKLYHSLLPREIRHDLGEYYTPDWLAERLIRQTLGSDLGNPFKRVLDPACGSGTFLVLLINHIKRVAQARRMGPTETLDAIRKGIVGFDLNPLAVIAARTNYILALGDLLKEAKKLGPDGIDIPVYQCDSVLTPSTGEGLFGAGKYPLPTSVGVFEIPSAFATKPRMETLANLLDECVESGVDEETFLERLSNSADMFSKELEEARQPLRVLFAHLSDLHSHELNGRWARIIKNAFAPLFFKSDPADYVVGNPPWVNWEHLPDDYRRSTMKLWNHYGLLPKRENAMDTILGAAKYDLSMLMTCVSADEYLLRGGKLGFVLSLSLFKTAAAGQGFRRFVLPDGTPLGPLIVEDMQELNPFEGATNKTVVAIFGKGQKVNFPVPYSYWVKKKTGRGSGIGFDTPYESVTNDLITFRRWEATHVNSADPTSAWITGKPKALRAMRKVVGPSEYVARAGTFTGGANAVYWVKVIDKRPGNNLIVANITEGAKKKVEPTKAAIESVLIYPLLRGADVSHWSATPNAHIILTHESTMRLKAIPERRMQSDYPKAFAYFKRFEEMLRKRAAFRRYFKDDAPFYSIFNIGEYTFSKWKVVWREQASGLTAAVVGSLEQRPVIPDHKLMTVAVDSGNEAHFLCAALNSAPSRLVVASYAIEISMDTHILQNVRIPMFSDKNGVHREMAELSREAHKAAAEGDRGKIAIAEQKIDEAARTLWGLDDDELEDIRGSLIDRGIIGFEWEKARTATKRVRKSLSEEVLREREQDES
jgi:SAM-dependent methyltransferase